MSTIVESTHIPAVHEEDPILRIILSPDLGLRTEPQTYGNACGIEQLLWKRNDTIHNLSVYQILPDLPITVGI